MNVKILIALAAIAALGIDSVVTATDGATEDPNRSRAELCTQHPYYCANASLGWEMFGHLGR
jgi:hypothetical protein